MMDTRYRLRYEPVYELLMEDTDTLKKAEKLEEIGYFKTFTYNGSIFVEKNDTDEETSAQQNEKPLQ